MKKLVYRFELTIEYQTERTKAVNDMLKGMGLGKISLRGKVAHNDISVTPKEDGVDLPPMTEDMLEDMRKILQDVYSDIGTKHNMKIIVEKGYLLK